MRSPPSKVRSWEEMQVSSDLPPKKLVQLLGAGQMIDGYDLGRTGIRPSEVNVGA